MAYPESTWMSPQFSTDGDSTARQPAQPDRTHW